MALWCLGVLDHRPPANSLVALLSDQGQVALYKSPDMENICIADLAKKLFGGT